MPLFLYRIVLTWMLFQHEMEKKPPNFLKAQKNLKKAWIKNYFCVFVHQSVFDSDGDAFVFVIPCVLSSSDADNYQVLTISKQKTGRTQTSGQLQQTNSTNRSLSYTSFTLLNVNSVRELAWHIIQRAGLLYRYSSWDCCVCLCCHVCNWRTM